MNNPLKIIIEVLSIIDYQGDKEQMAKTFLQLVHDNAILGMIDNLEPERKVELQKKLAQESLDEGSEDFLNLAKEYFTQEQYTKALQQATEKLFAKYLTEIMPTLTNEQQDKLFAYLGTLANQLPA